MRNSVASEGVIKFTLTYTASSTPPTMQGFAEFNQCRNTLWQLGVIGQDDARYEGLGYGNVSLRQRTAEYPDAFLITGSQTGHLAELSTAHYARVLAYDISRHCLQADGVRKPSSEAMTHAAIYQQLPAVNAIIHGHSPIIWQQAQSLGLACTGADIPYGTPQMAAAMQALLAGGNLPGNTIVMRGHQDGFITWGENPTQAVALVRQLLQDANFLANK